MPIKRHARTRISNAHPSLRVSCRYTADPLAGVGDGNAHRILGGETLLWGELVSPTSVLSLTWPRAAGYGGRLWTNGVGLLSNHTQILLGLQAHADRLQARGIPADRVTTRSCALAPHLCFGTSPPPPPPPPPAAEQHDLKMMMVGMTSIVIVVAAVLAFGFGVASAAWRFNKQNPTTGKRRATAGVTQQLLRPRHPLLDSTSSLSPEIPPDRALWDDEPLINGGLYTDT